MSPCLSCRADWPWVKGLCKACYFYERRNPGQQRTAAHARRLCARRIADELAAKAEGRQVA